MQRNKTLELPLCMPFRQAEGLAGYLQLFPAPELGVGLTAPPLYPPPTAERAPVTFWAPEYLSQS